MDNYEIKLKKMGKRKNIKPKKKAKQKWYHASHSSDFNMLLGKYIYHDIFTLDSDLLLEYVKNTKDDKLISLVDKFIDELSLEDLVSIYEYGMQHNKTEKYRKICCDKIRAFHEYELFNARIFIEDLELDLMSDDERDESSVDKMEIKPFSWEKNETGKWLENYSDINVNNGISEVQKWKNHQVKFKNINEELKQNMELRKLEEDEHHENLKIMKMIDNDLEFQMIINNKLEELKNTLIANKIEQIKKEQNDDKYLYENERHYVIYFGDNEIKNKHWHELKILNDENKSINYALKRLMENPYIVKGQNKTDRSRIYSVNIYRNVMSYGYTEKDLLKEFEKVMFASGNEEIDYKLNIHFELLWSWMPNIKFKDNLFIRTPIEELKKETNDRYVYFVYAGNQSIDDLGYWSINIMDELDEAIQIAESSANNEIINVGNINGLNRLNYVFIYRRKIDNEELHEHIICKEKTYTLEEWKDVFNEITYDPKKTKYELIWKWAVDFEIIKNITIYDV